jgi:hypothetical protein
MGNPAPLERGASLRRLLGRAVWLRGETPLCDDFWGSKHEAPRSRTRLRAPFRPSKRQVADDLLPPGRARPPRFSRCRWVSANRLGRADGLLHPDRDPPKHSDALPNDGNGPAPHSASLPRLLANRGAAVASSRPLPEGSPRPASDLPKVSRNKNKGPDDLLNTPTDRQNAPS